MSSPRACSEAIRTRSRSWGLFSSWYLKSFPLNKSSRTRLFFNFSNLSPGQFPEFSRKHSLLRSVELNVWLISNPVVSFWWGKWNHPSGCYRTPWGKMQLSSWCLCCLCFKFFAHDDDPLTYLDSLNLHSVPFSWSHSLRQRHPFVPHCPPEVAVSKIHWRPLGWLLTYSLHSPSVVCKYLNAPHR